MSLLCSAIYAKCPYYEGLYMQTVRIILGVEGRGRARTEWPSSTVTSTAASTPVVPSSAPGRAWPAPSGQVITASVTKHDSSQST